MSIESNGVEDALVRSPCTLLPLVVMLGGRHAVKVTRALSCPKADEPLGLNRTNSLPAAEAADSVEIECVFDDGPALVKVARLKDA
jgi:hypothetical protein